MEAEEILLSRLEKTFWLGHRAAAGVSVSSPSKSMPAMSSGITSVTGCPSTGWILLQCASVVPKFDLLKTSADRTPFTSVLKSNLILGCTTMTLRKKCFIIRQSLISVLGSSSTSKVIWNGVSPDACWEQLFSSEVHVSFFVENLGRTDCISFMNFLRMKPR